MGKSKRVSFLRGRRMRATRIDAAGRPIYGDNSVVTTKGFISVGYTANTEEGEAISVTNAGGEACVAEPPIPSFNGFGVEATFCEVDFSLFEMLTGQEVVLDENGEAVGLTESTAVDLTSVQFALELWLGATTDSEASEGSQGRFGYVLTPFLGGGVLGDVTVENAAITFTVTGMQTRNGSSWGSGPYNVELVGGVPSPLRVPMKSADHRRIQYVEVAPPEVYPGTIPLLDPADPAITGVTATVTGLSAALEPTPTGPEPVWYDFGDGEWDYAETGSYDHEYAAPGTYTVTATRGGKTVTEQVTVGA